MFLTIVLFVEMVVTYPHHIVKTSFSTLTDSCLRNRRINIYILHRHDPSLPNNLSPSLPPLSPHSAPQDHPFYIPGIYHSELLPPPRLPTRSRTGSSSPVCILPVLLLVLTSSTPPTFLDQPRQLYHCLHLNLTLPTEPTKHIKPWEIHPTHNDIK